MKQTDNCCKLLWIYGQSDQFGIKQPIELDSFFSILKDIVNAVEINYNMIRYNVSI